MNIVLDASVAAKWVLVEEDTDKARAIFDAFTARRIALLAPQILPAEVASTLWKRVMRGLLPPDAATRLQTQFDSVMVPLSPIDDLVGTALGLAIRYRHSVYDGLYLALAQRAEADFVTADERLFRVAGQAYPNMRLLRQWA